MIGDIQTVAASPQNTEVENNSALDYRAINLPAILSPKLTSLFLRKCGVTDNVARKFLKNPRQLEGDNFAALVASTTYSKLEQLFQRLAIDIDAEYKAIKEMKKQVDPELFKKQYQNYFCKNLIWVMDLKKKPYIVIYGLILEFKKLPTALLADDTIPQDFQTDGFVKELRGFWEYINPRYRTHSKNLNHLELKRLPISVLFSEDLVNLNLEHNALTHLPYPFTRLKALKTLNLSYNNFTEFPMEILALKALETLDLRGNAIKQIPLSEILKTLPHLTNLKFSCTQEQFETNNYQAHSERCEIELVENGEAPSKCIIQ